MNKKILFYIILIIIILILVFLSQQAISREIGRTLISAASGKASGLMSKEPSLGMLSIGSKISDSVKSGGETIQNTVEQTKQNISTAKNNITNYFSGIANAIAGKSDNNNCTTTPAN